MGSDDVRSRSSRALVALVIGCVVAAPGCDGDGGGNDAGTGDGSADGGGDAGLEAGGDAGEGDADLAECPALAAGMNEGFLVDGEERGFILDLPSGVEEGGPWPVVFGWHGLGASPGQTSNIFYRFVDNEVMPFIGVSPTDTDAALFTLVVDWDVMAVDEQNKEARLFDELVRCLDQAYGVDRDRIYSIGISMGGFVTDALGTVRGEELASVVTFSGGYGSNPANLSGYLASIVDWPEHAVENDYAQLIAHGGPTDILDLGAFATDFYAWAQNDIVFLNERGHDVVECNHESGHTVPMSLVEPTLVRFLYDHPRGGGPSPYAAGLPEGFPDYCVFHQAAR